MTIPGAVTVLSTVAMAGLVLAQEQSISPSQTIDPTLLAAAIVTVIAAIGGVIVQVINSVSAARDRREAAAERKALLERANATAVKADTLITSTAQIHELTNSTNSNLQKALELMTEKFQGSERALAQAQETRRTVAAAQAVTDLKHAIVSQPPGSPQMAAPVLDSIEQNTNATAKNTARTDAAVNELKNDTL